MAPALWLVVGGNRRLTPTYCARNVNSLAPAFLFVPKANVNKSLGAEAKIIGLTLKDLCKNRNILGLDEFCGQALKPYREVD